MYLSSQKKINILKFAQQKLLCVDNIDPGKPSYSSERGCAVLSQRLALDIKATGYVASGFKRNVTIAEKAQEQIANHMRVCVAIPEDLVAIYGIAASEPILSEAASYIMRNYTNFSLFGTLSNVLDAYGISPGDCGELLVAAFFTRARDLYVQRLSMNDKNLLFPITGQICPIFSVVDLLSNLFDERFHSMMLDSLPSVYRMGDTSSPQKLGDVFRRTRMHFNHLIKPSSKSIINRQYLLNIMARGAGALGTNCQPGYYMIVPFLYEADDLDIKRVGFIMVQVKKTSKSLKTPGSEIITKMDPFACKLFTNGDTVPIIRIVFSLDRKRPTLRHMRYNSVSGRDGASEHDKNGQPLFTSYDLWCSGMGPRLLQPVDENGAGREWKSLLRKSEISKDVFMASSNPDLRRSEHPGGGPDRGHYENWLAEPHISLDELKPKAEDEPEDEDEEDWEGWDSPE